MEQRWSGILSAGAGQSASLLPENPDIDSLAWMPGSSSGLTRGPGMTIPLSIRPLTVMAGLDPAIHEAARRVEFNVLCY
jgi:hypothetical protein